MFNRLYAIALLSISAMVANAQTGINYQGMAFDNNNLPMASKSIAIKISILSGSVTGPVEYAEKHSVQTNVHGLFNLIIGKGAPEVSAFAGIHWGNGEKFLKVEIDPANGTNFQFLGTSQLLSVPFALYAAQSADKQLISLSNDTLRISDGNYVKLGIDSLRKKNGVLKIGNAEKCEEGVIRYNKILKTLQFCNGSKWVTIIGAVPNDISLTFSVINASPSADIGSINLTVSGGTPPYSFKWSNGSTTEDIINLGIGIYHVTVKDANLDSAKISAQVTNGIITATDVEGNVYSTVTIGTQVWMAEDLRVTKARNGNSVVSYCYNDDTQNCTNGRLYRVYEISNVCPTGWHLPSDAEWTTLEKALGMTNDEAIKLHQYRGTNQGTQMKVGGTSGINIQLLGYYDEISTVYQGLNTSAYYWTSTDNVPQTFLRYFSASEGKVGRTWTTQNRMSIRCVKD